MGADAVKILYVGRIQNKRLPLLEGLQKHHEVRTTSSGKKSLGLLGDFVPKIVVLDAVSMRTPGERICHDLRQHFPFTPIIHIHPGPQDRSVSIADIVLFEPCTSQRLMRCVNQLLKAESEELVTCGPFTLYITRRILLKRGVEVQLNPKVSLLAEIFLRNPEQTLDRKTLMQKVWDTDYTGDTRTLDVHIRWLRQALEDAPAAPKYLKTVRGVGYRLELPEESPPA